MEFSSMCNDMWIGPSIGHNHAYSDGMNINFEVSVYDWSEEGDATLSVSIVDENGNQVFLDSMAIDGTSSEYYMEEDVSVLEEGEYCVHAELTETGQSGPYDAHTQTASVLKRVQSQVMNSLQLLKHSWILTLAPLWKTLA